MLSVVAPLPGFHAGQVISYSVPAHYFTNSHQFDGIHGACCHTPAAADTAAVVRAEHTAAMLPDAVFPTEMGTGSASLAEDIIDYRTIGTNPADTGVIGPR